MSRMITSILFMIGIVALTLITWQKWEAPMQNNSTNATWLWQTSEITKRPEEILTFLQQQNVQNLYLQIDQTISSNVYREFIQRANESGIHVHALDGEPAWGLNPMSSHSFFDWLTQYQTTAKREQQFSGVHLDVEPYFLLEWEAHKENTIELYQQTLKRAFEQTATLDLTIGIDIPFWFDTERYSNSFGEGILSEWLIDHSDSVTLLSYRNQANGKNGIIELSKNELAYAHSVSKQIWIGIETAPSDEGNHLSFHGKNNEAFVQQLQLSADAFSKYDKFSGFAIHSLESWMERN